MTKPRRVGLSERLRVAKEHLCPRDTNLIDAYESLEQLEEAIAEFNREINIQNLTTPHYQGVY